MQAENAAPVHIYLCGGLAIRQGSTLLGPRDFAGPQAELILAILATEHLRPLSTAELADVIWPDRLTGAWRASLRALVSRLRAALAPLAAVRILSGDGWYQLALPPDSSVDCLVAITQAHEAQALALQGCTQDALTSAATASMITTRPVLPEIAHPWVDGLAAKMRDTRIAVLDVLVQLWIELGQYASAIIDAEKILELDPLHESAYAGLMRAHLRSGLPNMDLHVYERCRKTLQHELGSSPGPMVEGVYQELLALT